MKPSIGFVLATYDKPEQTLHLCARLNEMFGAPPIAIHHDFSQTDLDQSAFPANVRFVKRWLRTRWASLTVVDAQLSALDLLMNTADPDWFVTLSTTDYPIQTADRILEDLAASECDVFLDSRKIEDRGAAFLNEGLGELAFRNPQFVQDAFNRYVAFPLLSPRMGKRLRQPHEAWVLRSRWLVEHLTPFSAGLDCYAGDFWLTGTRRIAALLLTQTPLWKKLHRHYEGRSAPEESFFHTLIGNTPGIRKAPGNLRYTDWRGCFAHPRMLGQSDFPALLASEAHFARKFVFEPSLLRQLDEAVAANANARVSASLRCAAVSERCNLRGMASQ